MAGSVKLRSRATTEPGFADPEPIPSETCASAKPPVKSVNEIENRTRIIQSSR